VAKGEATLLLKIKSLGEEVLDRLVITFDDVKAAIMGIPQALMQAYDAYREQEQAVNELNQAMINAGTYSASLQNKYLELAGALQKTTLFSDDQINSAQALLQAHIGNREVTEGLLKATLDLAQAKKMDLASAASLVGKAIDGEADVLKRYGIEIGEAKNESEKMANVQNALAEKFGGQAEAARKGTGGVDGFKTSLGELVEAIGSRVAPTLSMLAERMVPIIDFFTKFIDKGNLSKVSVAELDEKIAAFQKQLDTLEARKKVTLIDTEGVNREIDFTKSKLDELVALRDKEQQDIINAAENYRIAQQEKFAKELEDQRAQYLKKQEQRLISEQLENDLSLAQQEGNDVKALDIQMKMLQQKYKNEQDYAKKKALLQQMHGIQEQKFEAEKDKMLQKDRQEFYNKMISLQGSNNQVLAAAGKAFAIRQIAIDTPVAVTKALAAFPPPFNFAAAGLVAAAAAQQAAQVAGIPLAEGGIVKARPGGIQATIGEGGRDEAVIPLENGQIPGSQGGGNTYVFNGPIMGDRRQAQEFAQMIDAELLELRRNGESKAFERIT
jgi:inorganic pyrophosphatase